ncbi:class I SAM-dependent methyltransferase [Geosporobacter ferrireducens]|uniref:class I SAM-dependent methyltransferase n=1 Tax=Geosporobacter ferrireducens TaxID=1424294 RepID=UPI00139C09C6|nr:class I SAM-dependent methyltransferase [Geosporobacter ferrireducens]MTI57252.1 class I SAM-dependent methyltransferase [Geosporobacter ferrireducens]
MRKQKVWDFWSKYYEGLWVQKVSLGPTRREILNFLKEILKKEKKYRILDVGCGTGQLLCEIHEAFIEYDLELFGIDFSKAMIERAKIPDHEITFQQMDVREIKGLDQQYDLILCTHSFPYYENQDLAIKDFRALLKSEGYLLLAQASQNNAYDALTMFFVKFTTGKAKYPSVKEVLAMTKKLFQCEGIIRIKARFYMPSIYFFILKGMDL